MNKCIHEIEGPCSYCWADAEKRKEAELAALHTELIQKGEREDELLMAIEHYKVENDNLKVELAEKKRLYGFEVEHTIDLLERFNEMEDKLAEKDKRLAEAVALLLVKPTKTSVHWDKKVEQFLSSFLTPTNPADDPGVCLACAGAPTVHICSSPWTPPHPDYWPISDIYLLKDAPLPNPTEPTPPGYQAKEEITGEDIVVMRREDLIRFINTISNCDCDCCNGECLDCSIGKAALGGKCDPEPEMVSVRRKFLPWLLSGMHPQEDLTDRECCEEVRRLTVALGGK